MMNSRQNGMCQADVYVARPGWRVLLMLVMLVIVATSNCCLAQPYFDYAEGLLHHLPEGAVLRPDLEDTLAGLANAYRAQQGSETLRPSPALRDAARAHAIDMMVNNFMGHRASTGHDFDSRMHVFLGNPMRFPFMAENAAKDSQATPADAAKASSLFRQWVKSAPHRKALVNRTYRFVSTGVVQRGNMIWAVQIFWDELPPGLKIKGAK